LLRNARAVTKTARASINGDRVVGAKPSFASYHSAITYVGVNNIASRSRRWRRFKRNIHTTIIDCVKVSSCTITVRALHYIVECTIKGNSTGSFTDNLTTFMGISSIGSLKVYSTEMSGQKVIDLTALKVNPEDIDGLINS